MKLFHKTKQNIIHEQPFEIYSPVRGRLVSLKDVQDMVFSSGMMGDGIAIEPFDDILYSPVGGSVSLVFPTKHVIGINSKDGMKIILHIGIDTVELNGKGFQPLVKEGEILHAGDKIMKLDLEYIKKSYQSTIMLVVENSAEFTFIRKEMGAINAGDRIIKVERV